MSIFSNNLSPTDIKFFHGVNQLKPIERPEPSISKWIESCRVMPSDSPFPGYWRNSRTPYLVELMENMSPFSPIQHQVLLKGPQLGATAAAENIIGYWMKINPAAIMMMSATDDLLKDWVDTRLEPLIDSIGFRNQIGVQHQENTRSRKTGDKSVSKMFPGGFFFASSAQSPGKMRSKSIQILIRDEVDGCPKELRTGEGNWLDVSLKRTEAYNTRRKIFDFSTPVTMDESSIYPEYEDGDKCLFMLPCPHCEKMQPLEFGDNLKWGIKADTTAGEIVDAYYVCQFCWKPIKHFQKFDMMAKGRWEPTSTSHSILYKSYRIPGYYAPMGMATWKDLYKEFLKAKKTPDRMRAFTTLVDAMPYQETGQRPKIENVVNIRGGYKKGTVPDGVIFIVAGADVQRGSEKFQEMPTEELDAEIKKADNDPKIKRGTKKRPNFPRIEIEFLGHGSKYRTWSIEYLRLEGHVKDIDSGAWEKLTEHYKKLAENCSPKKNGRYAVYKDRFGLEFGINKTFIDAHDGEMTDTVYSYCQQYNGFNPIMGFQALKKRKTELGDELTTDNIKRYRAEKQGNFITYKISTNYYKGQIYNRSSLKRNQVGENVPGFMDHPREYDDHYYAMLFSAERRRDGSFHSGGRRDESLDCKVYSMCAGDVWIDAIVDDYRAMYKNKGWGQVELKEKINHPFALNQLQRYIDQEREKIRNN